MSLDLRKPKNYRKSPVQEPLPWMLKTTENFHIHVCSECRVSKYCDGPVSPQIVTEATVIVDGE